MAGTSFRFELTPVLQMRDRAVEAARDTLGRAVRLRRQAEASLAAAERPAAAAPDVRTAWQLSGASAHRQALVAGVAQARRRLDEAAAAERDARRALGDAVRAHEALLALRAEEAAAHQTRAARAEIDRLDDLALIARSARTSAPASS